MDELPIVEKLKEGVTSCGMHDDNSTELFDVEEASETMAEAATLIEEMAEALRRIEQTPNYRCCAADMRKIARAALAKPPMTPAPQGDR